MKQPEDIITVAAGKRGVCVAGGGGGGGGWRMEEEKCSFLTDYTQRTAVWPSGKAVGW